MRFLIALVMALVWAGPAWACSYQVLTIWVPERVPVGGIVPVMECYFPDICAGLPPAVVRDAQGAVVAGTLRSLEGKPQRIVWEPASPLTVGARYTLLLDEQVMREDGTIFARTENPFEVVAQLAPFAADGDQRVVAHVTPVMVDADLACCAEKYKDSCGYESASCTPRRMTTEVQLQVVFEGFNDARGQWDFAARVQGGSKQDVSFREERGNRSAGDAIFVLPRYSGRVCFDILARSRRDGSEQVAYSSCVEEELELPPDIEVPKSTVEAFLSQCKEGVEDGGSTDEVSASGDDGCQLVSGSTDQSRGLLTTLVMLALLSTRRRRARTDGA